MNKKLVWAPIANWKRLTRVGVRQAAGEKVAYKGEIKVGLTRRLNEGDVQLANPIWQPANDIDGNDGQYQVGHFPVRALLFL